MGLPGGPEIPPYLIDAETEAPGAARLHYALDVDMVGGAFTDAEAVEVGAWLHLDAEAVGACLSALRRRELVGTVPGPGERRSRTLPPGGVPF